MINFKLNPFVIAWDFDLTLTDSFTPWLKWCNQRLGLRAPVTIDCVLGRNGDLVPYLFERGIKNPFAYWEQHDLYDNMAPFLGHDCAKIIRELSDKITNITGREVHNIVVSRCAPAHKESKQRFLQTWFEGVFTGFVDTADKHWVKCDVMVDDSTDTLKLLQGTSTKLIIPTSHNIIDQSSFDSNYIMVCGEEGKVGSMWDQIDRKEINLTRLAMWMAKEV